jgi:hypothetical protein
MRTLVASLCAFLMSVPAWSQTQAVNAQLSGTITDPNKAPVPGAQVTLSNSETGFRRQFTTGETGQYTFALIPPGHYELTVEKQGFSVSHFPGVVLEVGQASNLDAQLQLGAVSQTVEVEASAPVLVTGSADIGSEVSGKQAVELPLNIRNVFGLVGLDSSVNNSQQFQALNPPGSQGNVDQDISFFNFGGGRMGSTVFLFDGHWDGAGDWDGIIYVPSVDELQEFKIQTNTYSPQYGWGMGNVVNAIEKSGTREFHGSAFEFLRNDDFDANNYFNNLEGLARPGFHRDQFGFTAGGPLYLPGIYRQRDKTFIFGTYEGLRQQTPTTLLTTVPTALQRQGNFSQTFNENGSLAVIYNPFTTQFANGQYSRQPFPGNIIPTSMLDSVALKLMAFYPDANLPGNAVTGANNYAGTAGLPTDSDQYTVRVDHNISDKQHFFARWSQKRQFKQLSGDFFGTSDPGGNGTLAPDNRWDGGLGFTDAFSPTFVMVANFGWGRWAEGRKPQGVPFDPSTVGLPATLDSFGGPGAFPAINISGENALGSGVLNATPREARTVSVDFTKIHGPHTFSMGFMGIDFVLYTFNSSQATFNFSPDFTQGPNPTAANALTGYGFASFLLGTGDNSGSGITLSADAAFTKRFFGWYFNDDWKVTHNLTLNLGLRYDFQTAPTDRFNRLSYFDPQATNPISTQVGMTLPGALVYTGDGNPRGVYNPQYTNFAPRIGLSYSPAKKLVFRAGFGLFYTPAMEFGDYQGLTLNGFSQTTPYVGTIDGVTPQNLLSNPFPTGLLQPPGKADGGATNDGQTVDAVLRNRPTPYVEMWSANLQYEVAPNTVLQAGYAGNHGLKLLFGTTSEMDALPPQDLAMGNALLAPVANPFYGIITSGALAGPTIPYGQLLRPYPEYTGVENVQAPAASSYYDALTLSANRRFNNGLQFLVTFTWSKYLDDSEGPEGWTQGQAQSVQNWYDTALEKSLMIDDIPRSFVASYIYELPVGKGKALQPQSKFVNAVVGGWQVAGITTLKDGFPLAFGNATNNTNSFGGGQRPNLIGNPGLANPNIYEEFNTAAFAQPAAFTFGDVPRTTGYIRSQGTNNFDASLQKYWRLWNESARLQFRGEVFNLFNRAQFFAPNTTFGTSSFGVVPGALPARSIQLGMKLYW